MIRRISTGHSAAHALRRRAIQNQPAVRRPGLGSDNRCANGGSNHKTSNNVRYHRGQDYFFRSSRQRVAWREKDSHTCVSAFSCHTGVTGPVSTTYTLSGFLETPTVPFITSTDDEGGEIILTVSVIDNGKHVYSNFYRF